MKRKFNEDTLFNDVPVKLVPPKRLLPISQTKGAFNTKVSGNDTFVADDSSKIQVGMQVLHERFGLGKVLEIEGGAPDLKATVFFQDSGQKSLLLKFAKLKIVNYS